MISSSSNLMISKEKYNHSRSSDKNSNNIKIMDTLTKLASEQNSLEMMDKSNNELEIPKRSREQNKTSVYKEAGNVTKTISSNNSKCNNISKTNSKKQREEKNKSVLSEKRDKSPVKNNTNIYTKKENKLNTINDYDTINKELDELKSNNMSSIYMVQKTMSDGASNKEIIELKNDIKDLINSMNRLTLRVENLEFENKQLKEENKNLYELINQNICKTNTSNLTPIEVFKQNNLLENNNVIKETLHEKKNLPTGLKIEGYNNIPRNRSGNSPLSDNSVFNSSHNTNPFENNAYTKINNNLSKNNNNNNNSSKTISNHSHHNSLTQTQSKKRFYLEKKEEN